MITLSRLTKYGSFNTHDLIKVIAIALMFIDHIGLYLLNDNMWCRLIGRAAAPLFFFLIGYVGKLHVSPSLIVFGIILSVSSSFINSTLQINILLNFILIYYSLRFFPPEKMRTTTRVLSFILFAGANVYISFYLDYGLLGFLIAYSARLLALKDKQSDYWLLGSLVVYFVWESAYFGFIQAYFVFTFAAITLALYALMLSYRLANLYCPKPLLLPGLVISRYSLEIYFIHLILLQGYYLLHSP